MRGIPAASRHTNPQKIPINPRCRVGPSWGLSEGVFGEFSESVDSHCTWWQTPTVLRFDWRGRDRAPYRCPSRSAAPPTAARPRPTARRRWTAADMITRWIAEGPKPAGSSTRVRFPNGIRYPLQLYPYEALCIGGRRESGRTRGMGRLAPRRGLSPRRPPPSPASTSSPSRGTWSSRR